MGLASARRDTPRSFRQAESHLGRLRAGARHPRRARRGAGLSGRPAHVPIAVSRNPCCIIGPFGVAKNPIARNGVALDTWWTSTAGGDRARLCPGVPVRSARRADRHQLRPAEQRRRPEWLRSLRAGEAARRHRPLHRLRAGRDHGHPAEPSVEPNGARLLDVARAGRRTRHGRGNATGRRQQARGAAPPSRRRSDAGGDDGACGCAVAGSVGDPGAGRRARARDGGAASTGC
jgi:hypothetical protein